MENRTCFVVCALGSENSVTRQYSDKVLKYLIEPVCKEQGFEVIRSDKITATDKIDETIINNLKTADLVIIDMSEHNPNVFYEFGFRHATGKPFIPIRKKSSEKIPFDVSTLRTIEFTTEVDDIELAKRQLKSTIKSIPFGSENNKIDENIYADITTSLFNIHTKLDKIIDSTSSTNSLYINEDELPF
ncbi:hypothetical protein MK559_11260 [Streptococcus gallolyticus subsp. gallolyticus]|uniref:hypothetical protein n=1 Tax=Streptococcus gallolyticus TaxID=315405 RepID=UPI002284CC09|nr:hypothetical protein [Streptococcus gallolyticus]MCY7179562.1 hypothetical protein [Streptococcus gallolyticus subsp. gallolyticus]